MVLTAITPAFAASGCQNGTTGKSSNNICNTILSKLKVLGLTNSGSVTHTVTKNAVSGDNVANNNTSSSGNVTVDSGNSSAEVNSVGSLNTGNIDVDQSDSTLEHVGTNNVTGESSNNTVNVTGDKTANLTVDNSGSVDHTVDVNARSGNNTVNNNTIAGGIRTGIANILSNLTSLQNDIIVKVTQ